MALAAHFGSLHPVVGHGGEINGSEEQLAVHDKGAFGEVMYSKIHVRGVLPLLSRFVEKIICLLQEPQIPPLACKSQLPASAIMSLHQCNIFSFFFPHPCLFHTTIYKTDSSNLSFNLFLTFQIMLPVICLYLFLDYNSNIVLEKLHLTLLEVWILNSDKTPSRYFPRQD